MKDYIKLPNKETLNTLCNYTNGLCVSITFSTETKGDVDKNRIRFKNAVQALKQKLEKINKSLDDYKSLKNELNAFLEEDSRWFHQEKGFALFWSKDMFHVFRTPFSLPEKTIIDTRFYLKDIILHTQNSSSFSVLMLNQEKVELGTGNTLSNIKNTTEPEGLINSLTDFLSVYEFEESLQFSRQDKSGASKSTSTPNFHGQGVAGDDNTHNTYLNEYVKKIENWVVDKFKELDTKYNFVIGDERIVGLYLKNTRDTHPKLEVLPYTNTSNLEAKELLSKIKSFIDSDNKGKTIELAKSLSGKAKNDEKVISNLEQIITAAHNKRIDNLVVANNFDKELWGTIENKEEGVTSIKKDNEFNDIGTELVNAAIIETYNNGGKVSVFDSEEAKLDDGIVATARW